ncbi:MAG: 16S rRNA (adenine1518-N6/adenine1519-N6)-dimethyltransferase [Phycisphaerales bacterium]|jgi:16S rRNA (adenine1518-N6/adenine1519-N6)-dimethyltransferase
MQTLSQIKDLLAERGLSPKKSLGQNFLTDHNLITRLIDVSGVGPGDLVLEIGPGTGALTEELLGRGCKVLACELDDRLAELNRDRFGEMFPDTFSLVHGDCLDGKRAINKELAERLSGRPFTMVANLPYGAATPLMLTLLTQWPGCGGQFVTVQREVADRLAAGPSQSKVYGAISVVASALSTVKKIAVLPRECFWPRPDVTSAMIGLTRCENPIAGDDSAWWPEMAQITSDLFQTRRKQLGSTLRRMGVGEIEWPTGVVATDRPEALTPEQIVALARAVRASIG